MYDIGMDWFMYIVSGLSLGMPVIIFCIAFLAVYGYLKANRDALAAMGSFGILHGLTASPQGVAYKGLLPGRLVAAVVGVDSGTHRSAELFYYFHTVGSGKNRREYQRTVVGVSIKPTHQHIYVNARLNDMTEQMPAGRYVRYQAEGQFSKYFDIYTPEGKQVEALSLFAPDLMARLMAEFGQYDIEILDDKLYVYAYSKLTEQAEMEALYQLVNGLAVEVDSNAPRKVTLHQAAGDPEASAVTTMHGHNLKGVVVAVVFFVVIQLVLWNANFTVKATEELPVSYFIMLGILAVTFIIVAIQMFRGHRLSKQYEIDRQQFLADIR